VDLAEVMPIRCQVGSMLAHPVVARHHIFPLVTAAPWWGRMPRTTLSFDLASKSMHHHDKDIDE